MNQKDGVDILEELKQLDYELHIRIDKSHLSEDQWDWLIYNFKDQLEKKRKYNDERKC